MGSLARPLQPSDSGADLSFPPPTQEDYTLQESWERFWAVNWERLIWASWIDKYSDYIDPSYLENTAGNKDLDPLDNRHLSERDKFPTSNSKKRRKREGKVGGKSTPEMLDKERENLSDPGGRGKEGEGWSPLSPDDTWNHGKAKVRSYSENDQLLSPRCDSEASGIPPTVGMSDSMTNVTKITSYEINSSHMPTDSSESNLSTLSSTGSSEDALSSTGSSEREALLPEHSQEEDTQVDQYWQILWKTHFDEQYAVHFDKYFSIHPDQVESKPGDEYRDDGLDFSESNSQEFPSVIEARRAEDTGSSPELHKSLHRRKSSKKRSNKPGNTKYIQSVGYLLQSLAIEHDGESLMQTSPQDGDVVAGGGGDKTMAAEGAGQTQRSVTTATTPTYCGVNPQDSGDEPPRQNNRPTTLKRR